MSPSSRRVAAALDGAGWAMFAAGLMLWDWPILLSALGFWLAGHIQRGGAS